MSESELVTIPHEATPRELITMIEQIEKGDSIAIFNARKALYIYIDNKYLIGQIKDWLLRGEAK